MEKKDIYNQTLTPQQAAQLKLNDTYGFRVRPGKERHRLCTCKVPCQRSFMCRHPRHVGNRSAPYCFGAHPGEECNDCFARERSS